MLKKLRIKNFKAIQDMTIEFTPLTVLIGGNACGKTTILQALDFLRSVATQDIQAFLSQKEWSFSELKSQIDDGQTKPIVFESTWKFTCNHKDETINWSFSVDQSDDKFIIDEKVTSSEGELIYNNRDNEYQPVELKKYNVQSSLLKIMGFFDNAIFSHLQTFLMSSDFFGLLMPEKMRIPNKNPSGSIGDNGMMLSSFIHGLSKENREKLNNIVSDLIGKRINIETLQDPSFGLVFLVDSEQYDKLVHITSQHMSDGLLRIIAYAAISLQKYRVPVVTGQDTNIAIENGGMMLADERHKVHGGMILLDEIEDGINPHLAEKVIKLLKTIVNESGRQVIATTHSPIILNDIAPDDIVFLWRDKLGSSHCKKLFSIAELRDSLEYLYPGDAWMNIEEADLLKKMNASQGGAQ